MLVFQRNSFLSLVDEEKQTNYCVISRLFEEVFLTNQMPKEVFLVSLDMFQPIGLLNGANLMSRDIVNCSRNMTF